MNMFRKLEDTSKLEVSSNDDHWVEMKFMADPFNSGKMNPHYAVEKNGIMIVLTSSEITYSIDQVKLGLRSCDLKIKISVGRGNYTETHNVYGENSYIAVINYRELPSEHFKKIETVIRNKYKPGVKYYINKAIVDMICENFKPGNNG